MRVTPRGQKGEGVRQCCVGGGGEGRGGGYNKLI